jgi:dihydrofolate reductase
MGQVVVDITVSVDGYVTAPGADLEHGLGVGGEPLHEWVMNGTGADRGVLDAAFHGTGAVVMGRRLFDIVDGPHGWRDDLGYGGEQDQSNPPPYFVVTHRAPETTRLRGDFTFVTDGVAAAVRRARAAAGEKAVVVMGGADVCTQVVDAGLADVVHLHVAPLLLGGGTRLFDRLPNAPVTLRIADVVSTPHATHITYDVRNG